MYTLLYLSSLTTRRVLMKKIAIYLFTIFLLFQSSNTFTVKKVKGQKTIANSETWNEFVEGKSRSNKNPNANTVQPQTPPLEAPNANNNLKTWLSIEQGHNNHNSNEQTSLAPEQSLEKPQESTGTKKTVEKIFYSDIDSDTEEYLKDAIEPESPGIWERLTSTPEKTLSDLQNIKKVTPQEYITWNHKTENAIRTWIQQLEKAQPQDVIQARATIISNKSFIDKINLLVDEAHKKGINLSKNCKENARRWVDQYNESALQYKKIASDDCEAFLIPKNNLDDIYKVRTPERRIRRLRTFASPSDPKKKSTVHGKINDAVTELIVGIKQLLSKDDQDNAKESVNLLEEYINLANKHGIQLPESTYNNALSCVKAYDNQLDNTEYDQVTQFVKRRHKNSMLASAITKSSLMDKPNENDFDDNNFDKDTPNPPVLNLAYKLLSKHEAARQQQNKEEE